MRGPDGPEGNSHPQISLTSQSAKVRVAFIVQKVCGIALCLVASKLVYCGDINSGVREWRFSFFLSCAPISYLYNAFRVL